MWDAAANRTTASVTMKNIRYKWKAKKTWHMEPDTNGY